MSCDSFGIITRNYMFLCGEQWERSWACRFNYDLVSVSQVILEIMWWSWTLDTSPSLETNGNRKCIRLTLGKLDFCFHTQAYEKIEKTLVIYYGLRSAWQGEEISNRNHLTYDMRDACNWKNVLLISCLFISVIREVLNNSLQPKCTKKTRQL